MRRLEGKVVIVAGAGGIGNGLAARYCAEGAAVVLGDVDQTVAQNAAEAIAKEGGRIIGIALDGAHEDAIVTAVALAQREFGGLHGFHANFSSFVDGIQNDDVLSLPLDSFDEMMRVNARGFFLCTRHAVPAMIASGGGTMLYTSSGAAYVGEPVRVAYAMSKAAGHALARHVANRFGGQGIRANVIAPGLIAHPRFDDATLAMLEGDLADKAVAIKTRIGKPDDIAGVGAMLISDDGGFITGQVFCVDGGGTMRA